MVGPLTIARGLVLVALLVWLGGTLLLLRLDDVEDASRIGEVRIGEIAALSNAIDALHVKHMAAVHPPSPTTNFRSELDAARRLAQGLAAEASDDALLQYLTTEFTVLVARLDDAAVALESGDFAEASRIHDDEIHPLLRKIKAEVAASTATYRAAADTTDAAARLAAGITLFGGGLIVAGLLALSSRQSRRASALLAQAEARFRSLVQSSSDVSVIVSPAGEILYESPAAERVLGVDPAERVGRSIFEGVDPQDIPLAREALARCVVAPDAEASVELRVQHATGRTLVIEAIGRNLVSDPAVAGVAIVYRDISDRRSLEEQLRRQALHDPLTELPNRTLLIERLEHALARTREGEPLSVLFIDLDDFKRINDTLGHGMGDALLRAVGARLTTIVRPGDTVARLGGDEFAVLVEDGLLDPHVVAQRLVDAFREPFAVAGSELRITASLGLASRGARESASTLLRNADVAMYRAKAEGKNRFATFTAAMHASLVQSIELENDLHEAVARGEFLLHFQPIYKLDDGAVVGAEALVRWQHPRRGLLSPSEFVGAAERTGLIVPLGAMVLREACGQLRRWRDITPGPLWISVNVSPLQLEHEGLVEDVLRAVDGAGIHARDLMLEITESVALSDAPLVTRQAERLRAAGVRVAIDDFGAGYSSLQALRQIPVDVLKIDRSLLSAVPSGASQASMMRAVVGVAASVGATTVAEGIETEAQLAVLRDVGCDLGQGYLFSRPAPAESTPLGSIAADWWNGPLGVTELPVRPKPGRRQRVA